MLFRHGPLTANEVFVVLHRESKGSINAASNSAARFSELRDLGVVYEVATRSCSVTGMTVIQWDVTDRLPKKVTKKTTEKIKCSYCKGKGYVEQLKLL